jgi:hypothetical protein
LPYYGDNLDIKDTIKKLIPANFESDLEAQFDEQKLPTLRDNIYLPHLDSLKAEEIIWIREKYKSEYFQFEDKIEKDLNQSNWDESNLLKELRIIDQHVHQLDNLSRDINDAVTKQSIYRLGVIAMSVAAAGIGGPIDAPILIGAIGGVNAENFRTYIEYVIKKIDEKKSLKSDDFFVCWKVNHIGSLVSIRMYLEECLRKLST